MQNTVRKVGYLPNLDPLRFFAAATVIFYHVDNFLVANGYKNTFLNFFPFQHGDIAVVFFFTLSGFLITYLLLSDKKAGVKISIKKFYLKRILRIWPLYYLVVILAFTVLNVIPFMHVAGETNTIDVSAHVFLNTILLILIAPNVVLLNSTSLGYANPTWSIGVEEQFYLIWPWIIRSKHFLIFNLLIIISMFFLSQGIIIRVALKAIKLGLISYQSTTYDILFYLNKFFTFAASFRIDAMAIGALGAYMVINWPLLSKIAYSLILQFLTYFGLLYTFYYPHIVTYQIYAILFTLAIVNLSTNAKSIISFKFPVLNYLGRISYGIYMLHLLTILPAIKLINGYFGMAINLGTELLICTICMTGGIALASLSYHTFEKFFLSFKKTIR